MKQAARILSTGVMYMCRAGNVWVCGRYVWVCGWVVVCSCWFLCAYTHNWLWLVFRLLYLHQAREVLILVRVCCEVDVDTRCALVKLILLQLVGKESHRMQQPKHAQSSVRTQSTGVHRTFLFLLAYCCWSPTFSSLPRASLLNFQKRHVTRQVGPKQADMQDNCQVCKATWLNCRSWRWCCW